jgi:hypothetical protein
MPPINKYHGNIYYSQDRRDYQAEFRGLTRMEMYFKTREAANAWIIDQNAAEGNIRVKNIVYRNGTQYRCKLTLGRFFLFDERDLPVVQDHIWFFSNGYVKATVDKKEVHFTHVLLGPNLPFTMVDHFNRNSLDNRRSNLRRVPTRTNLINRSKSTNNTSGVTGVYYHKRNHHWMAQWVDESGKRHRKGFPIRSYGEEVAKKKAIAHRKHVEESLAHYKEAFTMEIEQ